MTQTNPLFEARNLAIFRGEHCLIADLSFAVSSGQVLQVQGDNGTGKTTLLRALCGLQWIEEGALLWRGQLMKSVRDNYLAEMIYAGHTEGIKSDLTARENLRFSAQLRAGQVMGEQPADIDEALELVGLIERADLPCRALSAGQRRRVVMARLLCSSAALWILDEPLTSLDQRGRELVATVIGRHVAGGGAVILTTHQPLPDGDFPLTSVTLKH